MSGPASKGAKESWRQNARGLGLYAAVVIPAHLAWEILQLPLYTIWAAPLEERIIAVVHCTAGDALIAASSLAIAIVAAGKPGWPAIRFWPVALLTVALGVAYTGCSEWLNVAVRGSWAYSGNMPVLTVAGFGLGLSPVLQWVAVPALGFTVLWRFRSAKITRAGVTGKSENPNS